MKIMCSNFGGKSQKTTTFVLQNKSRDEFMGTKCISKKKKKHQKCAVKASFSLKEKRRFFFDIPLAITVAHGLHPLSEIKFLKKVIKKGLLTNVTWIPSGPNDPDERVKFALTYLHSPEAESFGCKMKKGYDYAWIKIALDRGPIPSMYSSHRFMSTPKFIDYIKSLGFTDIAGSKTLNKFIALAQWSPKTNKLGFSETLFNYFECKRRNAIALKFIEILREIPIQA